MSSKDRSDFGKKMQANKRSDKVINFMNDGYYHVLML
jgi:hypothetical protein